MPTQTDCLNDALGQIGASVVTAIDDGSTNANLCKTFYPPLRDGVLRSHHWNFAMQRVELAADVAVPLFEFAYSYTLPSDLLKLVEYNGENTSSTYLPIYDWRYLARPVYKVEGRKIFTNDASVKIVYLKRAENPDEWDGLFYQAMTQLLASKLAIAIRKDPKFSMALKQMADETLALALAVDGQENPIQPFSTDNLLWGRNCL